MIRLPIVLFTIFFAFTGFSQDHHLIDSLEIQLKSHNATKKELRIKSPSPYDTTAVNILYALSKASWNNNPDKALDYARQSLDLSEQLGYKKGIGNGYNGMGTIQLMKGEYVAAIDYYKKSLLIREEVGNPKDIAGSYNNIGECYRLQGNYAEALKNLLASLKIKENTGDKQGIAVAYNNIGAIYEKQGNTAEALKNYQMALTLQETYGNNEGIATSYNNIGNIYYEQGNYQEALKNYDASLKLKEEAGNTFAIAFTYTNIGSTYALMEKSVEALNAYTTALKLSEEIGDKDGLSICYLGIGNIKTSQGEYAEAAHWLNRALSLGMETGSIVNIKDSYGSLAKLDSAQATFVKSSPQKKAEHLQHALDHYKQYILYRDSIYNQENTRNMVQQQLQYDFDKKESLLKVEQETKNALAQKELQKQKFMRNGFIVGTVLFLLLAAAIYMGLQKTGRAKRKSEELLLNILPAEVADELKATGKARAKAYTMVTVMFADFKDFTTVSEKVSAELLVDEIHTCFSAFDAILQEFKIEKIKTIGDAYLCAGGLPVSNYTHPTDMIAFAFKISGYMQHRKLEKEARGEIPFEIRIGIHTGPVVAGIVGVKKYAYDIWGDTVNLAARMEQNSEVGRINISGVTHELVKDKFTCSYRGKIAAKNKGEIDMYFVDAPLTPLHVSG